LERDFAMTEKHNGLIEEQDFFGKKFKLWFLLILDSSFFKILNLWLYLLTFFLCKKI
jgi:hypothetical protein